MGEIIYGPWKKRTVRQMIEHELEILSQQFGHPEVPAHPRLAYAASDAPHDPRHALVSGTDRPLR